MEIIKTKLPGVIVMNPKRFDNERGLSEIWNKNRYEEIRKKIF